eukprot:m.393542 g.393542  ORF g.393542 m.393542 type:complete len:99 (+) comp21087_c1_seq28:2111-2407(+)
MPKAAWKTCDTPWSMVALTSRAKTTRRLAANAEQVVQLSNVANPYIPDCVCLREKLCVRCCKVVVVVELCGEQNPAIFTPGILLVTANEIVHAVRTMT